MVGAHCMAVWSSTKAVVALSSGEAEYYSAVKGGCRALGFWAQAEDLNLKFGIKMMADSSAAKGMCNRRGLGKVGQTGTL